MPKLVDWVGLDQQARDRIAALSKMQTLPDYAGLTVDDLVSIGSEAASDAIVKAYRDNMIKRGK